MNNSYLATMLYYYASLWVEQGININRNRSMSSEGISGRKGCMFLLCAQYLKSRRNLLLKPGLPAGKLSWKSHWPVMGGGLYHRTSLDWSQLQSCHERLSLLQVDKGWKKWCVASALQTLCSNAHYLRFQERCLRMRKSCWGREAPWTLTKQKQDGRPTATTECHPTSKQDPILILDETFQRTNEEETLSMSFYEAV